MPNSVERSLFKIGDGGLAVTIPKSWWSYYGLKPADKVAIITNGSLTMKPMKRRKMVSL